MVFQWIVCIPYMIMKELGQQYGWFNPSVRSTSRESRQQSTESLRFWNSPNSRPNPTLNTEHWPPVKSAASRTNKDRDFERVHTSDRVLQRFVQFCNSLKERVAKTKNYSVAAIFVSPFLYQLLSKPFFKTCFCIKTIIKAFLYYLIVSLTIF